MPNEDLAPPNVKGASLVSVTMKFVRDTKRYLRYEAIGGQSEAIGTLYVRKENVPLKTAPKVIRVDVTSED